MRPIKQKLTEFIRLYFVTIQSIIGFIFLPISDFLGGYSESLGDFVRNISNLIADMISILPVFIISLIVGSLLTNKNLETVSGSSIDPIVFLSSILLIGSLTAFFIAYFIVNHTLKNSIYLFILLLSGAILINQFNKPAVYIMIGAIVYGIGGYTASVIEFKNPLSHGYVYDDLQPQKDVLNITSVLTVPIICLYIVATHFLELSMTGILTVSVIIGVLSFTLSNLQRSKMESYYRNIQLDMMSQFWILTPRLGVITGVAFIVQNSEITYFSLILLLMPSIFGCVFYMYIDSIADMVLGNRYLGDSDGFNEPFRVTPYENVNIKESKFKDDIAQVSTEINLEISHDLPDNPQTWIEMLVATHYMNKSINSMTRVDEDLDKFQDNIIGKVIKKQNSDIDFDNLPKSLSNRIIEYKSKNNQLTNQDIMDIELRNNDRRRLNDSEEYSS